ncbi:MAG: Holliday junction resolvase RuvX [Clostridia bacterium]|nr:Holliday junction resolvase RuvX [Clostridia bacterium]
MRIMGIDFGDSRIGIAMSDPLGWTAQGLETIHWKGSWDKPIERIRQIAAEYKSERIVVGFPKNMNGTVGPRGEKTQEFIDALTKVVAVEIIKWDERLTTVAANKLMHATGVKTSKKKGIVDQIAAVYILQGYLDSISSKS